MWMQTEFDKQNDKLSKVATGNQLDEISRNIRTNSKQIKLNRDEGRKNTEDIAALRGSITNIEREILGKHIVVPEDGDPIQAMSSYASRLKSAPSSFGIPESGGSGLRGGQDSTERREFLEARNSLQFWPIAGRTKEEMLENFLDFVENALGMSRKENAGVLHIKRVKSAPRGKAYKEVCVVFTDSNTRDEILMRGPMLSGFRDQAGRPTAGIRLRIPAHLMGVFKTLETFGHRLRHDYGENFKKHIKYDEYLFTMYIQVGVKKEGETTEWTNYTAEQAREANRRASEKKRGAKIDFLASPPKGVASAKTPSAPGTSQAPRTLSLIHI